MDILKPKSEEEILTGLNKLKPNDLLLVSCRIGYLKGIHIALRKGANINGDNDLPLRSAAKHGHYDVVKLLIDLGANIHAFNNYALRQAAEKGHYDIVKLLIDKGANIHTRENEPLVTASEYGHYDIVKILIDKGADVDKYGIEAIWWAVQKNHYDIVKLLLDNYENKFVNESLDDILKPKSQEEIENELSELSILELYDLWLTSENDDVLLKLLDECHKKGENPFDEHDIIKIITEFPESKDKIITLILDDLSKGPFDVNIDKAGNKYKFEFDGWHAFSDIFTEGNIDIYYNILEGSKSFEYFDVTSSEIDINDYIYIFENNLHKIKATNIFKQFVKEELKKENLFNELIFNKIDKMNFKELLEWLNNNIDDEEDLPKTYDVLNTSIAITKEIADETEAFMYIVKKIKDFFNIDKTYSTDNSIYFYCTDKVLMQYYLALHDDYYAIESKIPYYKWDGDMQKHLDVFNDELINKMDDYPLIKHQMQLNN